MNKFAIPLAIVIAGAFIAYAIYNGGKAPVDDTPSVEDQQKKAAEYIDSLDIADVSDADHIQGDKNAKVTIVEYSDTECPYCKTFHQTLNQIFNDYYSTSTNRIAWVYRQFPIVELHAKAPKEAEATECANELGGPKIFWKYLSTIFTNTPSNDGLDPAQLVTFADQVGLDTKAFTNCVNSGKYTAKINESVKAAARAGATATPYTVLLVRNGTKVDRVPLIDPSGASLGSLPYASMKAIIERLLNS